MWIPRKQHQMAHWCQDIERVEKTMRDVAIGIAFFLAVATMPWNEVTPEKKDGKGSTGLPLEEFHNELASREPEEFLAHIGMSLDCMCGAVFGAQVSVLVVA